MKISTPQAVIIAAVIIALAILFRADYPVLATEAKAAVGGKDYNALRNGRDFRRAAASIVEKCEIRGSVRQRSKFFLSTDISC